MAASDPIPILEQVPYPQPQLDEPLMSSLNVQASTWVAGFATAFGVIGPAKASLAEAANNRAGVQANREAVVARWATTQLKDPVDAAAQVLGVSGGISAQIGNPNDVPVGPTDGGTYHLVDDWLEGEMNRFLAWIRGWLEYIGIMPAA